MPKIKTHKATSKKLNVRPGGTIKIGRPGARHNFSKLKNGELRNKKRQGSTLSKSDAKRLKTVKY